jgi:hypothetical protein
VANAGACIHGLFPGLTADLLGVAKRLLPNADGIGARRAFGHESQTDLTASFVTRLGQQAAYVYHQQPDARPLSEQSFQERLATDLATDLAAEMDGH